MHGKCALAQNKHVSETSQFPSYSTFSKGFTKQSFALRRGCHKRLSGCWFTSYKHFLLGLLTASYIYFWTSALQQAEDLLIILKMSKSCLCCCCPFPPLWLLVAKLLRAPTTVRLPEIMEHQKCSPCYDTSGNTEEETKIVLIEP